MVAQVGRSNIVGMPAARLLQDLNATVTVCHSRTKDLPEMVRQADIVVPSHGFGIALVTRFYLATGGSNRAC